MVDAPDTYARLSAAVVARTSPEGKAAATADAAAAANGDGKGDGKGKKAA